MKIDEERAHHIGLTGHEIERLEVLAEEGYIDTAEAERLINSGDLLGVESEINTAERDHNRDVARHQGHIRGV